MAIVACFLERLTQWSTPGFSPDLSRLRAAQGGEHPDLEGEDTLYGSSLGTNGLRMIRCSAFGESLENKASLAAAAG